MIAACLTGLLILLFLGSWRSTLIIAVSIPLSILSSLCVLSALGHTMNVMTLGGLALAIGILVDDATVTIENIHRHMGRKPLFQSRAGRRIANRGATLQSGAAADPLITGGYGSALTQLAYNNFPTYSVGVQLALPIRNLSARSEVLRDELTVRQQQIRIRQLEKQIWLEVTNASIAVDVGTKR